MPVDKLIRNWSAVPGPIGLFGGSFDPIQNAHCQIADASVKTGAVRSVVFIPAHLNPLKQNEPSASGRQRLDMISLAIEGRTDMYVSDIELRAAGASYTIETVRAVSALAPGVGLIFIMGSDCLPDLHKWSDIHALVSLLQGLLIYPRPGNKSPGSELPSGRMEPAETGLDRHFSKEEIEKILGRVIEGEPHLISATDIRERIRGGKSVGELVPPAVEKYIREHRLYTESLP